MSRRVYLYFAVTFLLGIVLGGTGVYCYAWYTGHWHHGFNKDRAVARLKSSLQLDDGEVQQIRQIFDDASLKMRDLQQQTAPQYQALREDTRNRIRGVLDAEQAKKFDEIMKQIDARRRRLGTTVPSPR